MEWTDELIQQLTALWGEGLSTGAIARRMGISKNAVVGKAHRLNLTARPSPIRKDGVQKAAAPRRVTSPTLPKLASEAKPAAAPAAATPVAADHAVPKPRQVTTLDHAAVPRMERVEVTALRTIFAVRPAGKCQWPTSSDRPWVFCHAATSHGRSYCQEHAAKAYIRFQSLLSIEPATLRLLACEMKIDGSKTRPLIEILTAVNAKRLDLRKSQFFVAGMPEPGAGVASSPRMLA